MRVPALERPAEVPHVGRDIALGLRWTWGNAPVRTLTLTIVAFNVAFGAAWSVLVLYAMQQLGLGAIGFGLLTTVMAAGGVVGMTSYDWLERHASLANLMRVGLLIETFTHLGLAVTTDWRVAMAIMFVFGVHIFIWARPRAPCACERCRPSSRAESAACTRSASSAASSLGRRSAGSSRRSGA